MSDADTLPVVIPVESIAQAIYFIRGQKVILDSDLARFYEVETYAFNRAVKRNLKRFPPDFMFHLTPAEFERLTCQIGMSKQRGGRRHVPYVFTEHGAVMAATILNSERATAASIYVIRAFIRLREILSSHAELGQKMVELEERLDAHDGQIIALIDAIRELLPDPETSTRRIGFRTDG